MTTTVGQVANLQRLVNWIGSAWEEIQTKHDDWDFMRSSNILGAGASWVPASGQASSPLGTGPGTCGIDPTVFGKWDRDTFRSWVTASGSAALGGEMFLDWIPFDSWRDGYMLGAMRAVTTRPVAFAIGPDKSICLGPPPNGLYTITADYWFAPTVMEDDADVPLGLPAQFHMAIVYKAMQMYAGYEAAPEVFQRGETEYNNLMAPLEAKYLPEVGFAGALC